MLRRKRRDTGGIPTASMSDVAFLLLVFFLSTTKFDIKKGLGIVLPVASQEATKKVKLKEENITKVWIDKEGQITVISGGIDEQVPMGELEKKIRKIVSQNPDMVISLKTDRKSKYQYMVMALDRLQAAGAEKISLSTN
ncbi:MAG: biopolymer transporter ExbD [Candidatus Cloacimonetes bacterium]|jgi:biopolymer transport protein ExbD|nr:biopolymer transporter ExbD [Candidatus Cloacimonadota bacterium]